MKPFHYLPEKIAIRIGRRLGRINANVNGYENLFGSWGLSKTSIKNTKEILEKNHFKLITIKTRFARENSIFNTAKWPLADLFTWHVEFYAQKK